MSEELDTSNRDDLNQTVEKLLNPELGNELVWKEIANPAGWKNTEDKGWASVYDGHIQEWMTQSRWEEAITKYWEMVSAQKDAGVVDYYMHFCQEYQDEKIGGKQIDHIGFFITEADKDYCWACDGDGDIACWECNEDGFYALDEIDERDDDDDYDLEVLGGYDGRPTYYCNKCYGRRWVECHECYLERQHRAFNEPMENTYYLCLIGWRIYDTPMASNSQNIQITGLYTAGEWGFNKIVDKDNYLMGIVNEIRKTMDQPDSKIKTLKIESLTDKLEDYNKIHIKTYRDISSQEEHGYVWECISRHGVGLNEKVNSSNLSQSWLGYLPNYDEVLVRIEKNLR